MSKAIEAMKEEGWEKDPIQGIKDIVYDYEYVYFRRPKQKPNAVVDFDKLNEKLDLLLREECRLSDVLACIKKTND